MTKPLLVFTFLLFSICLDANSFLTNPMGKSTVILDKNAGNCLSIGGTVWNDENKNGLLDNLEVGLIGILIKIEGPLSIGTILTLTAFSPGTTYGGYWEISEFQTATTTACLIPGEYTVTVSQSNFDLPAGSLINWFSSPVDAIVGPPYFDNDDNGPDNLSGAVSTAPFNLDYFQQPTGEPDDPDLTCDSNNNMTIDFGYYFDCQAAQGPPVFETYYNCDDAFLDPLCDIGVLNNYCGSMSQGFNGTGPTPICPTGCSVAGGITGVPDNTSWVSFIASQPCIDINIYPSDCQSGTGLQWGVYEATEAPCNGGACIVCDGNCNGSGVLNVQSCNFIPGQQYFLLLDGCNGTYCDYEIEVIDGAGTFTIPPINAEECLGCLDPNPTLGLPYEVCSASAVVQFTVDTNLPAFPNYYDSYSGTYEWSITPAHPSGPIPNTTTNELIIDLSSYPIGSTSTICMDYVGTQCSNAGPHCFEVVRSDLTTPIADFTYEINGTEVSFTNESIDAMSYQWFFGDGNSSDEINPIHTYVTGGAFDVLLLASDTCGLDSLTQTLFINIPTVADFDSDTMNICAPYEVSFYDSSSINVTSWKWIFTGGAPDTSYEQHPLVTYSDPGLYDVTLEVMSGTGGDTIVRTDYIEVEGLPTTSYDYTLSLDTLFLSNLGGHDDILWTTSDGGSYTDSLATHVFKENGNYDISFIVNNVCGADTSEFNIVIDTIPSVDFSSVFDSQCLPVNITYENLSTGATSYLWTFENGFPATSTEKNPIIFYNQEGQHDVTLEIQSPLGDTSITKEEYIDFLFPPVADFEIIQSATEITLVNTSVATNATYYWEFGDGNTSEEFAPVHTYASLGNYAVRLTVTNACGPDILLKDIVLSLTVPDIVLGYSSSGGCVPLVIQITDQSTGNPDTWEWDFPGGVPSTSSLQNPTVTYNEKGYYTINALISNGNGSSSYTLKSGIEALDVAEVDFDFIQNAGITYFNNLSEFADNYSWDFGDGDTSNDIHPVHTYAANGTYLVKLTGTNVCGESRKELEIEVMTSGIEEITQESHWTIYPNPNQGKTFYVAQSAPSSSEFKVEIIDACGRNVIYETLVAKGLSTFHIKDGLPAGLYWIILQNEGYKEVKKVIVI